MAKPLHPCEIPVTPQVQEALAVARRLEAEVLQLQERIREANEELHRALVQACTRRYGIKPGDIVLDGRGTEVRVVEICSGGSMNTHSLASPTWHPQLYVNYRKANGDWSMREQRVWDWRIPIGMAAALTAWGRAEGSATGNLAPHPLEAQS